MTERLNAIKDLNTQGNVRSVLMAFNQGYRVLEIPVYQRNYDWSTRECGKLFDDLEEIIATGRKAHFFGAIVGKPQAGNFIWTVIDGQQRLTSVSLLMLALVHAGQRGLIKLEDQKLPKRILDDYLKGKDDGDEVKFKLKPVKNDDKAYRRLFGDEADFVQSSTVTANYLYFLDRLTRTKYSFEQIWEAIDKLQPMHLELEEQDDPQRIFESLNSTGKALSEADKTRNFVLMGVDSATQERLYEDFWNPIELNVEYRTDWFIRWYLVTKTHRTPKESDVYESFKSYATVSPANIADILEEMYRFSKISRQIREARTGFKAVDRRLTRANLILGDVILPLLWPVVRDTHDGVISEHDLLAVVEILESFTFRRVFSGVAANALNKIFAIAYNELRKMYTGDQSYHVLLTYLLRKRDNTSGRFPSDTEFREAFETRNAYSMRGYYQRYLFDALENGHSNDHVDIAMKLENGDISVEHVMPQRLTDEWRKELGADAEAIHETWLHRIANLTVTGYNSTYSNASFSRKKSMEGGFDESPYRLNRSLKKAQKWGEEELQQRSQRIVNFALNYWPLPSTDFEPPKAILPQEPMGTEQSFRGRSIVAFEYGNLSKTVRTWVEMVPPVLQVIAEDHREALVRIAEGDGGLLFTAEQVGHPVPRYLTKVDNGLYVRLDNSTDTKVGFLRNVFDRLGLDPEELLFKFKADKQEEQDNEDDTKAVEGKFSELTKYVMQLDEFAESQDDEGLAELIGQLEEDFEEFRVDAPAEALGGRGVADFGPVSEASADEVLALLTQQFRVAEIIGRGVLTKLAQDGTLSSYLKRLEELG